MCSLEAFLKTRSIKDETSVINGSSTPPAKQLIINAEPILTEMIDMGHFHGDFILSNILLF